MTETGFGRVGAIITESEEALFIDQSRHSRELLRVVGRLPVQSAFEFLFFLKVIQATMKLNDGSHARPVE